MPPIEVLGPILRLLLAALLGGVAGASLASVLYRRAARAVRRDDGAARRTDATDAASVAPRDDGRALAHALARARSREAAWRKRRDELEARERGGRRRIDTLLAEQQAAEERQSRLEAELRTLRAERDLAGREPMRSRPSRAEGVHGADATRWDAGAVAAVTATGRPEGVPVLNRRVDGGGRSTAAASVEDYPVLAESELPERAETLRLEDLLDEGAG